MTVRVLSFLLILLLVGSVDRVAADDSKSSKDEGLINCAFYRSKRDGVPVYQNADRSSRVLRKLVIGEYVCHIGSRGEFAIVDWRRQELINKTKGSAKKVSKKTTQKKTLPSEQTPELAYVRLVDLWQDNRKRPSDLQQKDYFSQAKDHLNSIGDSLAPDDIYGPLRPIIDVIHPPTECRAGKEICEKVEEDMRKFEEERKKK